MRVLDDAAVGPFERVVHAVDEASGLRAVVAVHSTASGPAIGGTRFHPYSSDACAAIDALRLAEGMTLKAAAAGLPVGGGKAVIIGEPERLRSPDLWRAYAAVLELFAGDYYTAEDVGTSVADMAALKRHSPYVLGVPDGPAGWDGDPSPLTARGVVAAIGAAWEADTGAASLEGVRAVVQGVGKVGAAVAGMLAADGARLVVSDAMPARAEAVAAWTGAAVVAPDAALGCPCEFLVPCAVGGVLRPEVVPDLGCRWVVGAANNQLSDDSVAARLAEGGIGYVPDFIANAGGLIAVAEQLNGWSAERVRVRVDGIRGIVRELIGEAWASGETTLATALRRARAGAVAA